MKTETISQIAEVAVHLNMHEASLQYREREAIHGMLAALKEREINKAVQLFQISMEWSQLLEFIHNCKLAFGAFPLTYIVDTWFLQDLIRHLTPNQDEEITYVTGVSFGQVRILSRICEVALEKQSAVYARATAKSCTNALATILDKGNRLQAMAHSHPGRGSEATHESSIDVKYLGRIQRAGADVIGVIVTRDGCVRFFTVEKPFRVWVQGNGVTQIDENVFQITLSEKDHR